MSLSRRTFLSLLASSPLLSSCVVTPQRAAYRGKKVVIIGGGFAGATAAKYIRRLDADIEVTLVEQQLSYTTGPANNWVLGGLRNLQSITFNYQALQQQHGVKLLQDTALSIDPIQKMVTLKQGEALPYERLIIAPGTELDWTSIENYTPQVTRTMPHAWKGAAQIDLLQRQLHSMDDGGVVIIAVPPMPYACPPAPYERASLIAHYLKQHKPKSKVLILDAQQRFALQPLFMQGWERFYGFGSETSLLEHIPEAPVLSVKPDEHRVVTANGEYQGDVINIIPAQQAPFIVRDTELTDVTGWCPVHPLTWESTEVPHIHIIGDATLATPMPKSAFAANSQAKSCAVAIVALLNERELTDSTWLNTCYSLVNPHYGISTTMVYRYHNEQILLVPEAGGQTPIDGNQQLEAVYADSWYSSITRDSFALG